jgi:hypothetical protein
MAKKASKKRGADTKFSIKTLNYEIDGVLARLKGLPATPSRAALLLKMKAIKLMAHCGEDMSFDLSHHTVR